MANTSYASLIFHAVARCNRYRTSFLFQSVLLQPLEAALFIDIQVLKIDEWNNGNCNFRKYDISL